MCQTANSEVLYLYDNSAQAAAMHFSLCLPTLKHWSHPRRTKDRKSQARIWGFNKQAFSDNINKQTNNNQPDSYVAQ